MEGWRETKCVLRKLVEERKNQMGGRGFSYCSKKGPGVGGASLGEIKIWQARSTRGRMAAATTPQATVERADL